MPTRSSSAQVRPAYAPQAPPPRPLRIVIVGGHNRTGGPYPPGVEVTRFWCEHSRQDGNAERAVSTIEAGSADVVFLLARWCSHKVADKVRTACRATKVQIVTHPGGESSLLQAISVKLIATTR